MADPDKEGRLGSTSSDGQPPESDVAGWLQTFVPPIALELDGRVPCPGYVAVDGSVLSADIAGFTSLAERLASRGKEGSEQLNVVVNSRIRALIDVSQRYGGGILKFGGDGILVLFKDEGHARRAVATGLEMHRALAEFDATSADESSELADEALSISVGIAEGPFDLFLVGNSEAKDLLIAGSGGRRSGGPGISSRIGRDRGFGCNRHRRRCIDRQRGFPP